MTDGPIYNDAGEPIGWSVPVDGGGMALVDDNGNIRLIVDEDGAELDPSEFEFDVETDPGEDNEEYAEPESTHDEPDLDEPEDAPEPEPELVAALDRELTRLQKRIGRPITRAEAIDVLGPRLLAQSRRGYFDAVEAADEAAAFGDQLLDLNTPASRHKFMAQRLKEKDQDQQRTQPEAAPPAEPDHDHDLATSAGRAALIRQRMTERAEADLPAEPATTPEAA